MGWFSGKSGLSYIYDPINIGGNVSGALNLPGGSGLSYKKNKKGGFDVINPIPFGGQRPLSEEELRKHPFLGKPYTQFGSQIDERSRGEGLVGFDPKYRQTLKSEYLQDFDTLYDETRRRRESQAASQGLRGGIPMDIATRSDRDLFRARQSGLADIDIAGLEARRADINSATYAQPDLVNLGAGIQQNRANFDLAEYNATQPTYLMDEGGSNTGSSLAMALAMLMASGGNKESSALPFALGSSNKPSGNNSLMFNPGVDQIDPSILQKLMEQNKRRLPR